MSFLSGCPREPGDDLLDEKRGLVLRDGTTVGGDEGGRVMLLAEVRLTRPRPSRGASLCGCVLPWTLRKFLHSQLNHLGTMGRGPAIR